MSRERTYYILAILCWPVFGTILQVGSCNIVDKRNSLSSTTTAFMCFVAPAFYYISKVFFSKFKRNITPQEVSNVRWMEAMYFVSKFFLGFYIGLVILFLLITGGNVNKYWSF